MKVKVLIALFVMGLIVLPVTSPCKTTICVYDEC